MANTIDLVFGADQPRTTNQIISDLQIIAKNVEASGVTKLKFAIDTGNIKTLQNQTDNLGSGVSSSVSKYSKQLVQYYKDLDKQSTSFNQKNLNGIDFEIKKRELAAKQFSSAIKSQMQQEQKISSIKSKNIAKETNAKLQYNRILEQSRDYYEKYSTSIQKNSELDAEWQEKINQLTNNPEDNFTNQTAARKTMSDLTRKTREAGLQVETLGDKIKRLFGIHLSTALTMVGVHLLIQSFKQMVTNVVQLDSEFTQFRIVTQSTDTQLTKFGNDAAKVAEQVGSSITDIVNASTVFARLGYSSEQSLDLSKLTTIYSKVANVDMSNAESNITSIVRAFGVSTDQLESVLDKLTYVGNNFPISASQIGSGLQNAGSALAAGGNSLEQSVALLTAAMSQTQD